MVLKTFEVTPAHNIGYFLIALCFVGAYYAIKFMFEEGDS